MPKTDFKSVDEYIAGQPESVQPLLERVRAAIRKALPDAAESISYRMPTYKLGKAPVLYFASWKDHYSLYPATAALTRAFARELASYEVARGTIRLPFERPVPRGLIGRLARFRAREVSRPQKAKATPAKKR